MGKITGMWNIRLFSILLIVPVFSWADIEGRVIEVLDGDTVDVLQPTAQVTRIRLAGIDAPEKDQPFGQLSRKRLSERVGRQYIKVTGSDTDRYGRLLGTLWLYGVDVNAQQVSEGMAWAYRYHDKATNTEYAELEASARQALRGLWSVQGQVEPWKWRREHSD